MKRFNSLIDKRCRKRILLKKAFNTRKLQMTPQIGNTNIIYTNNDRPNKTNFISMRSKGTKIIIKTYKSIFTVKVSREAIVIKCERVSRNGSLLSAPTSAVKVIYV